MSPCLFSGLRLAEQLGRREDEAKIRHGLGLSLWASGNLEEAQHQVSRALAQEPQVPAMVVSAAVVFSEMPASCADVQDSQPPKGQAPQWFLRFLCWAGPGPVPMVLNTKLHSSAERLRSDTWLLGLMSSRSPVRAEGSKSLWPQVWRWPKILCWHTGCRGSRDTCFKLTPRLAGWPDTRIL